MSSSAGGAAGDPQVRVAVVDDSAVIRGIVARWLESDPDIKVVATYPNGAVAVRQITDSQPDVVILDIEMPEMDGIEALPLLLKAIPDLKVIMASTLTRRNAEISLKALALGAVDYIPKPESRYATSDDFRRDLIQKVKTHAQSRQRPRTAARPASAAPPAARASAAAAPAPSSAPPVKSASLWGKQPVVLRQASRVRPQVLAVGSSTGGPQALFKVFGALGADLTVPVVVTQHMPATFTAILAEHIAQAAKRPAKEAQQGEVLQAGHIYVAPGDFHLTVVAEGGQKVVRLNQDPPENFCRPAVDPMFRSLAKAYGASTLAVVLTGMGADGREGGRALVDAGANIVVQDEASSVVWGMPGAVASAGLATHMVSLDQIAPTLARLIKGGP